MISPLEGIVIKSHWKRGMGNTVVAIFGNTLYYIFILFLSLLRCEIFVLGLSFLIFITIVLDLIITKFPLIGFMIINKIPNCRIIWCNNVFVCKVNICHIFISAGILSNSFPQVSRVLPVALWASGTQGVVLRPPSSIYSGCFS